MADEEIPQNRDDFKAFEMSQSIDPQIVHLTGRVDRLETDVHDIKAGVKELLGRPQNPGFTQVISTMLATLGICGIVFGFAKWHLYEAVTPIAEGQAAIIERMEKADKETEDNRVAVAVLNERSRWLEAQNGWKAKAEPGM